MVIYKCPKCGSELQCLTLTCIPPIHVWECPNCKWRKEEREEIIEVIKE